MFDLIAFDADDTLWHTEPLYLDVQRRFVEMMARYRDPAEVEQVMQRNDMGNLPYYGFGIKAFALSLIETAIEISDGEIGGREVRQVIDLARGMLTAAVELIDGVPETLARLSASYPLMLLTKGDLLDQEAKVTRSGLGAYFRYIEILSDKNQDSYAMLLARYNVAPQRFLMVGNSLRSDILPVAALGGQAVYIPYVHTWIHERVDPADEGRWHYHTLERIDLMPAFIESLS